MNRCVHFNYKFSRSSTNKYEFRPRGRGGMGPGDEGGGVRWFNGIHAEFNDLNCYLSFMVLYEG